MLKLNRHGLDRFREFLSVLDRLGLYSLDWEIQNWTVSNTSDGFYHIDADGFTYYEHPE